MPLVFAAIGIVLLVIGVLAVNGDDGYPYAVPINYIYDEEAIALVKKLAMKYYPDEQTVDEEIAESGKGMQMYEIEIEHLTGKEIQER